MIKGMIFAAGIGSRLKPFTDSHPKALVEVGGVTMLERVIKNMKKAGISDIVVNVHHFASQIVDFIAVNDNFGCKISISDESEKLLDTGGGLLKAAPLLSDCDGILVHNADVLSDIDLQDLIQQYLSAKPLATLSVSPRTSSRLLYFDSEFKLKGWGNTKSGETKPAGFSPLPFYRALAFSGIQIVNPAIFPLLEEYRENVGDVFSITPFYLSVCEEHLIKGDVLKEGTRWFDVGRPETLAQARESF